MPPLGHAVPRAAAVVALVLSHALLASAIVVGSDAAVCPASERVAMQLQEEGQPTCRPGAAPPPRSAHGGSPYEQQAAEALNRQWDTGLFVKIIASPPGGPGPGFDKKVAQTLGLRHGRQPEEEGYLPVGRRLTAWPRSNTDPSGLGIAGNWFTPCSFVGAALAAPYTPDAHADIERREAGTALYGCSRYGCGRSPESHKVLAVLQPDPVVGCGYVEDAGTNAADEFTGCTSDWQGAPGDWEVPKCLGIPDCQFQVRGIEFGRPAFFDAEHLPASLHFSGRFDPHSAAWQRFVKDQIRSNPKPSKSQVAAKVRHHNLGYNEMMVHTGTPEMLAEALKRDNPELGPTRVEGHRVWQCSTNGIAAFARLKEPPAALDEHAAHVENCRHKVFVEFRDMYDRACGKTRPTPILYFNISAWRNPFSAWDQHKLFPSQGPCDSDKAQPLEA